MQVQTELVTDKDSAMGTTGNDDFSYMHIIINHGAEDWLKIFTKTVAEIAGVPLYSEAFTKVKQSCEYVVNKFYAIIKAKAALLTDEVLNTLAISRFKMQIGKLPFIQPTETIH